MGFSYLFYSIISYIRITKRMHIAVSLPELNMKPITSILLVAALIVYTFLPIFTIQPEQIWTGFHYTVETLNKPECSFGHQLFALVPFLAGFAAIIINSLKSRHWGYAVAVCIALGLVFFIDAKHFHYIENPNLLMIKDVRVSFNISFWLFIAALVSSLVSIMPFKINCLHEFPHIRKKENLSDKDAHGHE
jgi:hypothetical protein